MLERTPIKSTPPPREAMKSPLSNNSWKNCPSPYLAPTKESLAYFQDRRERWKSTRRPKLARLPTTADVRAARTQTTLVSVTDVAALPNTTTATPTATPPSPKKPSSAFTSYQTSPQAEKQSLSLPAVSTNTENDNNNNNNNNNAPPLLASTSSSPHRERLIAFYQKHNPEKLRTVDATLKKFAGREDEMFQKLHTKYASSDNDDPYLPATGTGPQCFLQFSTGDVITIQLFQNKAPFAVRNFLQLCQQQTFQNCPVHRIVPNFCLQTGDYTVGNGTGGKSIYPKNSPCNPQTDLWGNFREDSSSSSTTVLLRHDTPGVVSMANSGDVNRNGSQFFIALRALPHLNGKHVVFGKVVHGMDAVHRIVQDFPTDAKQRPLEDLSIAQCGEQVADGATSVASQSTTASQQTRPVSNSSSNKPVHDLFGTRKTDSAATASFATTTTTTTKTAQPSNLFGSTTPFVSSGSKEQSSPFGKMSLGSAQAATTKEASSKDTQPFSSAFGGTSQPSMFGSSATKPFGAFGGAALSGAKTNLFGTSLGGTDNSAKTTTTKPLGGTSTGASGDVTEQDNKNNNSVSFAFQEKDADATKAFGSGSSAPTFSFADLASAKEANAEKPFSGSSADSSKPFGSGSSAPTFSFAGLASVKETESENSFGGASTKLAFGGTGANDGQPTLPSETGTVKETDADSTKPFGSGSSAPTSSSLGGTLSSKETKAGSSTAKPSFAGTGATDGHPLPSETGTAKEEDVDSTKPFGKGPSALTLSFGRVTSSEEAITEKPFGSSSTKLSSAGTDVGPTLAGAVQKTDADSSGSSAPTLSFGGATSTISASPSKEKQSETEKAIEGPSTKLLFSGTGATDVQQKTDADTAKAFGSGSSAPTSSFLGGATSIISASPSNENEKQAEKPLGTTSKPLGSSETSDAALTFGRATSTDSFDASKEDKASPVGTNKKRDTKPFSSSGSSNEAGSLASRTFENRASSVNDLSFGCLESMRSIGPRGEDIAGLSEARTNTSNASAEKEENQPKPSVGSTSLFRSSTSLTEAKTDRGTASTEKDANVERPSSGVSTSEIILRETTSRETGTLSVEKLGRRCPEEAMLPSETKVTNSSKTLGDDTSVDCKTGGANVPLSTEAQARRADASAAESSHDWGSTGSLGRVQAKECRIASTTNESSSSVASLAMTGSSTGLSTDEAKVRTLPSSKPMSSAAVASSGEKEAPVEEGIGASTGSTLSPRKAENSASFGSELSASTGVSDLFTSENASDSETSGIAETANSPGISLDTSPVGRTVTPDLSSEPTPGPAVLPSSTEEASATSLLSKHRDDVQPKENVADVVLLSTRTALQLPSRETAGGEKAVPPNSNWLASTTQGASSKIEIGSVSVADATSNVPPSEQGDGPDSRISSEETKGPGSEMRSKSKGLTTVGFEAKVMSHAGSLNDEMRPTNADDTPLSTERGDNHNHKTPSTEDAPRDPIKTSQMVQSTSNTLRAQGSNQGLKTAGNHVSTAPQPSEKPKSRLSKLKTIQRRIAAARSPRNVSRSSDESGEDVLLSNDTGRAGTQRVVQIASETTKDENVAAARTLEKGIVKVGGAVRARAASSDASTTATTSGMATTSVVSRRERLDELRKERRSLEAKLPQRPEKEPGSAFAQSLSARRTRPSSAESNTTDDGPKLEMSVQKPTLETNTASHGTASQHFNTPTKSKTANPALEATNPASQVVSRRRRAVNTDSGSNASAVDTNTTKTLEHTGEATYNSRSAREDTTKKTERAEEAESIICSDGRVDSLVSRDKPAISSRKQVASVSTKATHWTPKKGKSVVSLDKVDQVIADSPPAVRAVVSQRRRRSKDVIQHAQIEGRDGQKEMQEEHSLPSKSDSLKKNPDHAVFAVHSPEGDVFETTMPPTYEFVLQTCTSPQGKDTTADSLNFQDYSTGDEASAPAYQGTSTTNTSYSAPDTSASGGVKPFPSLPAGPPQECENLVSERKGCQSLENDSEANSSPLSANGPAAIEAVRSQRKRVPKVNLKRLPRQVEGSSDAVEAPELIPPAGPGTCAESSSDECSHGLSGVDATQKEAEQPSGKAPLEHEPLSPLEFDTSTPNDRGSPETPAVSRSSAFCGDENEPVAVAETDTPGVSAESIEPFMSVGTSSDPQAKNHRDVNCSDSAAAKGYPSLAISQDSFDRIVPLGIPADDSEACVSASANTIPDAEVQHDNMESFDGKPEPTGTPETPPTQALAAEVKGVTDSTPGVTTTRVADSTPSRAGALRESRAVDLALATTNLPVVEGPPHLASESSGDLSFLTLSSTGLSPARSSRASRREGGLPATPERWIDVDDLDNALGLPATPDRYVDDLDCDQTFQSREQASKSMAASLVVDPLAVSVVDVIKTSPMASMNLTHPSNWGGVKLHSVTAVRPEVASRPRFKTLDGMHRGAESHLACDPLMLSIAVASGQLNEPFGGADEQGFTTMSTLVAKFETLVASHEACDIRKFSE